MSFTSKMSDKEAIKKRDMQQLAEYREYLRQNPKLAYLFAELTDSCNLSCLHCGSNCMSKDAVFLDKRLLVSALKTVAREMDSSTIMFCLTGGEPLLHPEFEEIVQAAVQLGFPWGMTTNGILVDEHMAKKLKHLNIGSVTLSLDGLEDLHDWFRNRPGAFHKTLQAVEELKKEQIPVQITTVIHKKNYHQLEDMYALMVQWKVKSWRVINIEPIGRALQYPELMLDYEEIIGLLSFIRKKRFSTDTPIDVTYGCSHYLTSEYEREVRDGYFICGSGIYVASILCNGDIYSCLDIERRPELVQGNISKDNFVEVWKHRFQEFRNDRTSQCEMCSGCEDRLYCGGDSAHTWDYNNNQPLLCLKNMERSCKNGVNIL